MKKLQILLSLLGAIFSLYSFAQDGKVNNLTMYVLILKEVTLKVFILIILIRRMVLLSC